MKKYSYLLSTNTIWTSFDYGEVEANSYEEAEEKAIIELKKELEKCNNALKVIGFEVSMDFTQIELI
jgi:hypothetical protein